MALPHKNQGFYQDDGDEKDDILIYYGWSIWIWFYKDFTMDFVELWIHDGFYLFQICFD